MTVLPSSSPSAGGRRFWITVAIFALLNVGAWIGYHRWLAAQQPRRDILVVQNFSPGDDDILPANQPVTLSWTFNLDVAKPGPATPGPRGEAPGTLAPAINGEWLWTDARTLTFESHEPLPRATRFTAALNPAVIKTAEGYTLAKSAPNTFSTVPLQLESVKQAAFDGDDHLLLELTFNDKVIPGEVLQHLLIEGPDGKPVKAQLHGEGARAIVRVLTDRIPFAVPGVISPPVSAEPRIVPPPAASADSPATDTAPEPESHVRHHHRISHSANTLTVTLTPGLTGASGPLGLTDEISQEVAIANVLLADSLTAYVPTEGSAELTLTFNNAIPDDRLEALKPLVSVEPAIPFTLRSHYGTQVILNGDFAPATRYTVKIAKVEQADDPRKFPRPAVLSVFIPDREPAAYFVNSTGYLGSKGNRSLLVETVNVPAVYVTAERTYENNLVVWRNSSHRYWEPDVEQFSHNVAGKRYVLANKKNEPQKLQVNLDDLLGGNSAAEGVYRVHVYLDDTAGGDDLPSLRRRYRYYGGDREDNAVVTLSDIGLTAKVMAAGDGKSEQALLVWAVSLSTAKPLPGVNVRVYSEKNQLLGQAATNADGLARIEHVALQLDEKPSVLIAESGSGETRSLTWLDLARSRRDESQFATSGLAYLRSGYEAFVWAERGIYRPGETVTLRAVVRGRDMATPAENLPVRWQIRRPDGRDWKAQSASLDADGAAQWQVTFPDDSQTGFWSVQVGLPGEGASGSAGMSTFGRTSFQIEDFIPDRMKIALALSGPGLNKIVEGAPAASGPGRLDLNRGPMLADVQADYLFGQPAANLASHLAVRIAPSFFSSEKFPRGDGWITGDDARAGDVFAAAKRPDGDRFEPADQLLDKDGHTQFELDLAKKLNLHADPAPAQGQPLLAPTHGDIPITSAADPAFYMFRGPWSVTVTGNVTEVGGRAVTAYAFAETDALPYYLMLRTAAKSHNDILTVNTPATFEVAIITPAGVRVSDAHTLDVTIFKESWVNTLEHRDGRYQYESTRNLEPVPGAVNAAEIAAGAGQFLWTPAAPGQYVVQIADPITHQVTTLRAYVGNGGGWNDNISRENPERLEIQLVSGAASEKPESPASPSTTNSSAPDSDPRFQAGEKIRAIVRSPFPGRLLLTIETDTVLATQVVDMTTSVAEISLTLPEGARPNGYIAATVIRAVEPNQEWRTHRAFGLARFRVDSSDRKLNVQLAAAPEMRPSHTLDIDIAITNAAGQPAANSAVALAAVDEGILRLTGYATPNPLSFYNSVRSLGVESSDLYSNLLPEVAELDGASKVGGGGEGDESSFSRRHSSSVTAKRVRPVSLVSEIVHTNAEGKATVHLQVPEFLGQLRLMAVAYAGPFMGSGSSQVLIRSPLVVQSSFPRFLAPGDTAEIPFLIINNSQAAGAAKLHLTLDNSKLLSLDADSREIALQPGAQQVVTFKLSARDAVGTAKIGVEARLADESYTEHLELPVRPASPMISRGGFATATPAQPLAIEPPAGLLPGTASLQIRIAQRPALGMPEGLQYLDRYPYGCLEQTTSQCFPLVYLGDLGKQFAPGLFEQDRLTRKVESGITRLMGMQTSSGGLAMWQGQNQDWPWGSVYAAHFLLEARKAGYQVPEDFQSRLMTYVHSLLLKSAEPGPGTELQAYAAYVMALAGKPDRAFMNRLGEILDEQEKLTAPPEETASARFHLALAWAAAGRKDLAAKMLPDTLPTPRVSRNLAGNLGSPIRDQALMITTLLTIEPDHPALPQLIDRLSAAGAGHRWLSTQDNAFAILAMGKYLRATSNDKPFASADLLDGENVLGIARGNDPLVWTQPESSGQEPAARKFQVRVQGDAAAKAYVSWLQSGVSLAMPADADHALKIRRVYLTEEGNPLDLASLGAGKAVLVKVTVESPAPLSNVVIEDLLPAGLEVENPRLQTTQKQDADALAAAAHPIAGDRLDVRDDRIVMVANIPAGTSTWSYLARAVTPGTYIVPPIRGECMYDPGTSSLANGGGKLIITSVEKKSLTAR